MSVLASAAQSVAMLGILMHVMLQHFILPRTPEKGRGHAQLPAESISGNVHAASGTSVLACAAPAQTQGSF